MLIDFKSRLDEKLQEYQGKRLLLYGAGHVGNVAYRILECYGLDVAGYIVSCNGGGQLNGRPVYEVSALSAFDMADCKVILTLSKIFHPEVKKLLWNLGITEFDDSFIDSQVCFWAELYREIFEEHGIDIRGEILKAGKFKIPNPYFIGGGGTCPRFGSSVVIYCFQLFLGTSDLCVKDPMKTDRSG